MAATESGYELGPLCALRKDKIFIIFAHHNDPKQDHWLVVPGHKPVCPGQEVTWQAFGHDKVTLRKAEVRLPDVFDKSSVVLDSRGEGKATVRKNATPGDYPYTVICNDGKEDREAIGGSHPSVIVDWGR